MSQEMLVFGFRGLGLLDGSRRKEIRYPNVVSSFRMQTGASTVSLYAWDADLAAPK